MSNITVVDLKPPVLRRWFKELSDRNLIFHLKIEGGAHTDDNYAATIVQHLSSQIEAIVSDFREEYGLIEVSKNGTKAD